MATADLLMRQGYHATGLNQVVRESGAPKGSLYFHFPQGKEEIASEALRMAEEWNCGHISGILSNADTAADAVAEVAMSFARMQEENNFNKGCALLAVSQEVGDEEKLLRKALDNGFTAWRKLYVERFVADGFPEAAAEVWADLTLSSIEGAQALARAQRSKRPLENIASLLHTMITDARKMYDLQ